MSAIEADRWTGAVGGVAGHCPACGWQSLFLGKGGHVTCARLACPNPTAVDEILDDRETEHIVTLHATTFTIRHPLIERVGDALMTCDLHTRLATLAGPPSALGRYRVRTSAGVLRWEPAPCPTCSGPTRETVGMVCQTCGTDYAQIDGGAR